MTRKRALTKIGRFVFNAMVGPITSGWSACVAAGRLGADMRLRCVVAGWGYDEDAPLRPWPAFFRSKRHESWGLSWCGFFIEAMRTRRVDA